MSGNQPNEVDEVIKELKKNTGFNAYVIMNNDGIVIRHEHMEYKTAVHHAYLVLSLCSKARKHMRDLLDAPENEVESVRLKTDLYEMIISQHGNFTLVVIQMEEPAAVALEAAEVVEGAEGEKKEA
ncbi:hypothetical protein M885DRAFT_504972 [Pelagophyceae sp. CCMP2097]|nr:hypothetical protein M885DRAFT_504972 [Pelagophyceae sp. CCMP2097]|mmetsp:Transcript_29793/g.100333  ORF Transcript_29793/g.100333 Transcript_29793/m.100333 type:complete len:126 (-) Transcript_29793:53-430(-)